jgi:hypothetical protein
MKRIVLLFPLLGLLLFSCEKEGDLRTDSIQERSLSIEDVPNYADFDELNIKLDELNSMGEDERRIYEASVGTKSLLTLTYEVYEDLEYDSLGSIDELNAYISQNSNLIELRTVGENDTECYPIFSDNPYSVVANEDRLFSVGDMVFKVFDDGLVATKAENFNDLVALAGTSVLGVPDDEEFLISLFNSEDFSGKNSSACKPKRNVEREESANGNDRTKLKLVTDKIKIGEIHLNGQKAGVYEVSSYGRIRPYKKVLGVWFHAKRTINGIIAFEVSWMDGSIPNSHSMYRSIVNEHKYSATRTIPSSSVPMGTVPTNIKFDEITSWGDTPSTPFVFINCN